MKTYSIALVTVLTFVYMSVVNAQWAQTSFPSTLTVYSIAVKGSSMYAGSAHSGIYKTTNGGITWMQLNTGIPTTAKVYIIYVYGNEIYAGTSDGLFRSTNDGNSWLSINTGLTGVSVISIVHAWSGSIWVGTNGGGLYSSTNNGQSWNSVLAIPPRTFSSFTFSGLAFNGIYLFAGGRDPGDLVANVFRFSNAGQQYEVL
jgi:photosystem II stability/assembly factor-like uncharacterized protein